MSLNSEFWEKQLCLQKRCIQERGGWVFSKIFGIGSLGSPGWEGSNQGPERYTVPPCGQIFVSDGAFAVIVLLIVGELADSE